MKVVRNKRICLYQDEDVSIRVYKNLLDDGKTSFSLIVKMDDEDYFILDNRSLSVLRHTLEIVLPVALKSRARKFSDNVKLVYSLQDGK